MSRRTLDQIQHPARGLRMDDNLRGLLIVLAGAAVMVLLAFGAMVMLTSPSGWITQATRTAITADGAPVGTFGAAGTQN